ncbi:hypothetical protein, partial [Cupriavidus necator]
MHVSLLRKWVAQYLLERERMVSVQAADPAFTWRRFAQEGAVVGRILANGLEWSYGREAPAAQRLRFLLDFGYATGRK